MIRDLRLAWRMFLRGRGASLMTVAMLAIAMAGALTLFSVLTALTTLWPEIPARDRVARIYASNPRLGIQRDAIPFGSFAQWPVSLQTFDRVAAFSADDRSVLGAPDTGAQAVTPGYFEVFQVPPIAGRSLSRADADAGSGAVAVVSERLASAKFGAASDAIGKALDLDGEPFTIVGVMPRAFFFPTESAQVWIPLVTDGPANRRVTVVGRLRDGKQWPEAVAELSLLSARGNASASAIGWTITPIPLDEDQSLRARNGLVGLLGPALIVLLIAGVNTTNLLLARGVEREGEFRVRLALGASRGRVIRQLLVEGGVIALLATAAGAMLSVWGIQIFRAVVAGFNAPAADRIMFSSSTLLAVIAMAIATPIAVSIWPALAASRRRPASALTGATPSGAGRSGYGPRDLLVFAEVALASVLVVMALMVSRLYGELRDVHPSFDATPVAVADVGPDVTAAALTAFVEKAHAVPGVRAAAVIKGPMFSLGGSAPAVVTMSGSDEAVPCSVAEISADYFKTLQLPLVAGRSFNEHTGPSSGEAIVNAALAQKLWGAQHLSGGSVTLRTNERTYKLDVIGVAAEALAPNDFGAANVVYLPRDLAIGGPVRLLVRTAGAASSAIEPLSRELAGTATRKSLRFHLLGETIGRRDTDLVQWLLAMFSGLALMLAAGGIFAVSRHAVLQRTREFGIRLSLGATGGGLIRLVLRRDLRLAGLAVVVAAAGTLTVTRFTFWEMLNLAVRDPFFWASVLLILGGASTCACYAAARRISRLQPMDALRDS